MKIAIEARALSAPGGGVKTYVYELIKNLLQSYPQDSYHLLYDSKQSIGSFPVAQELKVPMHHEALFWWWRELAITRALRHLQPDVIHFTKADVPSRKKLPTVVTIYDIIPVLLPGTQSVSRKLYWPRALRRAATSSDHVITISEQSKQDIVEQFQIPADKTTVTPLAVDTTFFRPQKTESKQAPYILFVGTRDKRKNIAALLRAFKKIATTIPHSLVIVGRPALQDDGSKALAARLGLGDRVKFREDVVREELPALYSNADMFVWPSVYEGWGFPPQEAMACGTPVVVSNGGPLAEIVGEAGEVVPFSTNRLQDRFTDEEFEQQLALRMQAVLHDEAKKQRMREQGLVKVQKFSWVDVAHKTKAVYEKVVTSNS